MGDIKNKAIIGILTLSSLISLSTSIYVKNDFTIGVVNTIEEKNKKAKYNYKAINQLNTGALVGRDKDVFIYLGGEVEKSSKYDGKVNIGLGFININILYKYPP